MEWAVRQRAQEWEVVQLLETASQLPYQAVWIAQLKEQLRLLQKWKLEFNRVQTDPSFASSHRKLFHLFGLPESIDRIPPHEKKKALDQIQKRDKILSSLYLFSQSLVFETRESDRLIRKLQQRDKIRNLLKEKNPASSKTSSVKR